ncbi:DUF3578 domain-containing protein [Akkermansiaceae bacterium]|nr:DUF3578 domain-containing protein [Akkermansiaceae bacterium]MDB4321745.1 DUF3578 domain-containing protein [Akkermansiaceae bacterium]MDB4382079.1 DUF3578 domain-containing protein [Akkermansiaceae bacterium]MDC1405738.1 DUF3578 domain-containing protein [Akkermansiaceae bacterium]
MRETIRRVCELQPLYSSANTPEMQERGRLVRQTLKVHLESLQEKLRAALGEFGSDFHIDASDGIGNKTQLPWIRFCSKGMSPKATEGFYVVLHFSTDGSGVNICVGCSSSKFHNGYSIVLPPDELDKRTSWARNIVEESLGTLEPFTDLPEFGATLPLPKSFQRASAMVKKLNYDEVTDINLTAHLVKAAKMLRAIYTAQDVGRELSPADQVELDIIQLARPTSSARKGQGFGLTAAERKAVELQAMLLAGDWLKSEGYKLRDTSANRPYDFEARKDGQKLYVEVKGTTSDTADSIMMTHGEVDLHKNNVGQTALMIVKSIKLTKNGLNPSASGGQLEVLIAWDIETWSLQPTTFRVTRD